MEDGVRELLLLNKLSQSNRQLGQAYYLLELITEEKAIKKTSKERIEKFLLDAKKVKKVKNFFISLRYFIGTLFLPSLHHK